MEAQEVGNRVRRLAGDSSVSERSLTLPQGGRDRRGGGVSEQVVSIRNVSERASERVGDFAVEAKASGGHCCLLCASNLGLVLHLLLGSPVGVGI